MRAGAGRVQMLMVVVVLATAFGVPMGTNAGGGALEAGAVTAANAAAGPPDVLRADGRWTVTLLTGEVVDVRSDAEGRVAAQLPARTRPVRTVRKPDGELYVFPLSVTPLLDGVLDLELFNVTGLVRQG